jgi:hypothetical protein
VGTEDLFHHNVKLDECIDMHKEAAILLRKHLPRKMMEPKHDNVNLVLFLGDVLEMMKPVQAFILARAEETPLPYDPLFSTAILKLIGEIDEIMALLHSTMRLSILTQIVKPKTET